LISDVPVLTVTVQCLIV